jgi:hypothetical protein
MEGASLGSRRIATRYRLLLAVTVALLCFAAMRPQPAPADVMRKFQGKQVIWYDRPAAVRAAGSRERVVGRWRSLAATRGFRDHQAGCVARPPAFSGKSAVVLLVAEEVAYDPVHCRSLYRITRRSPAKVNRDALRAYAARRDMSPRELAEAAPDPNDPNVYNENSGGQYGPQPTDDAGAITAAVRRKVVTGYSAWEDVVQLDVNKVQNSINFRPSGRCAAASEGSLWDRISWRWGTGWIVDYRELQRHWACSHVTSKTYAQFRNMTFCPRVTTITRMWPNRVAGYPGGSWVHEPLGLSKSGACSYLLHSETRASVQFTNDPAFKGF